MEIMFGKLKVPVPPRLTVATVGAGPHGPDAFFRLVEHKVGLGQRKGQLLGAADEMQIGADLRTRHQDHFRLPDRCNARQALPDLPERIRRGDLTSLHDWLKHSIYRHGRVFTAAELVQRVTGAPIGVDALMDHLSRKYGEVYGLA